MAWGDSLTNSFGSTDSTKTYPYRLGVLTRRTVSNQGVNSETSTQIRTRLLAASVALTSKPTIIWAGRNNYWDTSTVLADVAAMVAALGHQRYIVLSVLNSDAVSEYSGAANYVTIAQLNADLASTYGARFVDVRSYLVGLYDPNNAQDVIDHGRDIPPSSLRSDTVHLNDAGYAAVANFVYTNRAQLGLS